MNPQALSKLQKVPEFRDLVLFIDSKISEVGSVKGIEGGTDEVALEARARALALKKLEEIFKTILVEIRDKVKIPRNKDFDVDVK